ncbi:type VI secretion system baseplate subunit TssE [Pseudomonas sp. Teo4]|uniref:type VI secretion system baseplate subunit TssE n=1 Tax=Pseudomonas sp. Teo4 TaxID=3064528 RepID=UPI002ABAC7B8|nr:type VI secretion system baseplate subunit TssE [Pseudomonas sp. Teo4]MDZ3992498.1 hypothetical protein [Pseudomonas sp. Teo4]
MSGLFHRLQMQAPPSRQHSRRENLPLKAEAIKRHVETLLNARMGCSQSSPDLGLSDFNGHASNSDDLLKQVSRDVRRIIRRYEPRIQVQSLHSLPDANAPLELHMRLDCLITVNNHAEQLQIELLINGHNRYTRVR